jgi:hypothetical protein
MAAIKRFEDLECWQEARKFVGLIYELTKNDQFRRDFELVKKVKKRADVTSKKVNNFITYLNMTLHPRKSTNRINKTSRTNRTEKKLPIQDKKVH